MLRAETAGDDLSRASVARLSNRLSAGVYNDKENLNKLLDQKDQSQIKVYFDRDKRNIEHAILYLTIKNDSSTLRFVLEKCTPEGGTSVLEEKENSLLNEKENPLLNSVTLGHHSCSKLLYSKGYRIPRRKGMEKEKREGEEEMDRYNSVIQPPGEEDQVEKMMIFKAYTDPHHLTLALDAVDAIEGGEDDIMDLQKLDPLRRAFDLAEVAEQYCTLTSDPLGSNELKFCYREIKEELEKFSHKLLTNCSNIEEVKTILEHNPDDSDDDEDDDEQQNWQKALLEGREKFVGHPFFQQFFRRKMMGHHLVLHIKFGSWIGSWGRSQFARWLWNILYVPWAFLLFCFYPIIVFADFFRGADILFVSPRTEQRRLKRNHSQDVLEDPEQGAEPESGIFAFFRQKIHTKVFRMIAHHTITYGYLAIMVTLIILVRMNEQGSGSSTVHLLKNHFPGVMYVAMVMAISYLIDDFMVWSERGALYFKSFWNPYCLINHTLWLIGLSSMFLEDKNLASLSGNDPLNILNTIFSFAVALDVFKSLRFLLLYEHLGPVVVCVTSVFKDVSRVVMVYIIILLAAFVSALSIFAPFSQETSGQNFKLQNNEHSSTQKVLMSLFWRILFAENPDSSNIQSVNSEEDDPFSMDFSHSMAIFHWVAYQVIMSILMLNILIAIMNTTYAEVWQNKDVMWKNQKTYYEAQFLAPRAVFPTPFRWIYYVAKYVYRCRQPERRGKTEVMMKKKKYFELLKKLIGLDQQKTGNKKKSEVNILANKVDELQTKLNNSQQINNELQRKLLELTKEQSYDIV